MSADHRAGATVDCPPGDVTVTDDGDRLRVTWHPRRGETRKALFRVATDDRVAVLQHIREIVTRQSGGPSGCTTRTDVVVSDVPRALRATARDLGFTLADAAPGQLGGWVEDDGDDDKSGLEGFC